MSDHYRGDPSTQMAKWMSGAFSDLPEEDKPLFITAKAFDYDALVYLMQTQFSQANVDALAKKLFILSLNWNHAMGPVGKILKTWVSKLELWVEIEIYPASTMIEPSRRAFQEWLIKMIRSKEITRLSLGVDFINDKTIKDRKVPVSEPNLDIKELSLVANDNYGRPGTHFVTVQYSGIFLSPPPPLKIPPFPFFLFLLLFYIDPINRIFSSLWINPLNLRKEKKIN